VTFIRMNAGKESGLFVLDFNRIQLSYILFSFVITGNKVANVKLIS